MSASATSPAINNTIMTDNTISNKSNTEVFNENQKTVEEIEKPLSISCVSCPGKVLISGGYIILDQKYNGLVLAMSCRFYTTIKSYSNRTFNHLININNDNNNTNYLFILVKTPQINKFNNLYQLSLNFPFNIECISGEYNKFAAYSLRFALIAILGIHNGFVDQLKLIVPSTGYLEVNLCGDKEFYTANSNASTLGKTGLGSSAALVSSLISCIFLHFLPHENNNLNLIPHLNFAHDLSQFIHCLVQGKVGSGFDISSAFYGSQKYRRFSQDLFKLLFEMKDLDIVSNLNMLSSSFLPIVPTKNICTHNSFIFPLNCTLQSIKLPPLIELVVGDVSGGSQSPLMVNMVLEFRKNYPDLSLEIWDDISNCNNKIESLFCKLSDMATIDFKSYSSTIDYLYKYSFADILNSYVNSDILGVFKQLIESFSTIKDLYSKLGELSNVPIIPSSQKLLLNYTSNLDGVLACGVPGAGGYDAIFVLLAIKDNLSGKNDAFYRLDLAWNKFDQKVVRIPLSIETDGIKIHSTVNNLYKV